MIGVDCFKVGSEQQESWRTLQDGVLSADGSRCECMCAVPRAKSQCCQLYWFVVNFHELLLEEKHFQIIHHFSITLYI